MGVKADAEDAPRTVLCACANDGQCYFGKWKANISSEEPVYQYRQASRDLEEVRNVHHVDWSDEVLRRNKLSDFEVMQAMDFVGFNLYRDNWEEFKKIELYALTAYIFIL